MGEGSLSLALISLCPCRPLLCLRVSLSLSLSPGRPSDPPSLHVPSLSVCVHLCLSVSVCVCVLACLGHGKRGSNPHRRGAEGAYSWRVQGHRGRTQPPTDHSLICEQCAILGVRDTYVPKLPVPFFIRNIAIIHLWFASNSIFECVVVVVSVRVCVCLRACAGVCALCVCVCVLLFVSVCVWSPTTRLWFVILSLFYSRILSLLSLLSLPLSPSLPPSLPPALPPSLPPSLARSLARSLSLSLSFSLSLSLSRSLFLSPCRSLCLSV